MNDLERILEAGREVPTPEGLTDKIKDSIDGQLGAGAGSATGTETATFASSIPVAAWAAGLLIVGVIVIFAGGFVGGSGDSGAGVREDSSASEVPAGDLDLVATGEDSTGLEEMPFDLDAPPVASEEATSEASAEPAAIAGGGIFGHVRDGRGNAIAGARVTVTLPAERRRSYELTVVADDTGFYEASLQELVSTHEIAISRELSAIAAESLALDAILESLPILGTERRMRDDEEIAVMERDLEALDRERALALGAQMKKEQLVQVRRDIEEQYRLAATQVVTEGSFTWGDSKDAVATGTQDSYSVERRTLALDRAAAEAARKRANTLTITALSEGFQPLAPVEVPFTPDERTPVDLVLADSEALAGVVIDASGIPVVGAKVEIVASFEGDLLPAAATQTLSGPAGEFSFDFLPPGEFLVRASGPQIETAARWITTGSGEVTLEVPTAGVATISVVDREGTPQFPVVVELLSNERTLERQWINDANNARFEGLRAGSYGLRVFTGKGGVYPALEESFSIAAGEEAMLEFVIPPAVTVDGTLVLPTAELTAEGTVPAGEFLVAAYHRGGSYSARRGAYSPVDENGEFHLAELPAGHYVFGVAKRLDSSMIIRCFRDVVLSAGDGAQNVRLPFVDTPLADLEIWIVDEKGCEIPEAKITFERARTMGRSTQRTDKGGHYEMKLHPDPFQLIVEAEGYAKKRHPVQFREGRTNHVIVTLEESPTLAVALETACRSEATIVLHQGITLRSLFAAIEFAEPGALVIDPELAASRLLDEKTVGGRGIAPLRKLLAGAIRKHGFEFELEGARLVLRFGEVDPRD